MKEKIILREVPSYFLILIWAYSGLEKFIGFESSRRAFHNQTFPPELADLLSYSIPLVELILAVLLLFQSTRWWGYLGSCLLFVVFVTYVGLIWVGAFPRVPCNCAGIIESLGWTEHLILNLILIGFSIIGLWFEKKVDINSKESIHQNGEKFKLKS